MVSPHTMMYYHAMGQALQLGTGAWYIVHSKCARRRPNIREFASVHGTCLVIVLVQWTVHVVVEEARIMSQFFLNQPYYYCAAGGVQERDTPGATSAPTNQPLPNSQRFLFGHGETYVGGSCDYANHSQGLLPISPHSAGSLSSLLGLITNKVSNLPHSPIVNSLPHNHLRE